MRTNALAAIVMLLLVGCDKQDKPDDTTEPAKQEPAQASPKPTAAPPKAAPAKTASVVDSLKQIVPVMPKVAGNDFEWTRSDYDTYLVWRLKQKAEPKRVALMLQLDDDTESIKNGSDPHTPKKFAGFPANRGKEFVRVHPGNVGVQISSYESFPRFVSDAVMEEVLNGLDFQALSKL